MTETKKNFDLIVLGTGSAGLSVAYRCRKAAWSVVVIDELPFGGTCALRGCDPKKILVGAAEAVDWHTRMQGKGLAAPKAKIDWPALMKFKRTFTDPVPKGVEQSLAEVDITAVHGQARLTSPNTIAVGDDIFAAKHVVIATGARPMTLDIAGEEHLTMSDQFLELEKLPERIVFVGGGFISFEFAHVAARAGAQVTIVHRDDQPLGGFDPDLVKQLLGVTDKIGVKVRLNSEVEAIEPSGNKFNVKISTAKGKSETVSADLVVHGAGRVPNINELDLPQGNVSSGQRGIVVNEYLQSVSNPAVYAAGDVTDTVGLPLTPIAGLEGGVVADNLLKGNTKTADYTATPAVVFTIPPLAAVGLREEEAQVSEKEIIVNKAETTDWYSSRRTNTQSSGYKVIIEKDTEKLLGAHLFGPHAEESINLFALAMRAGLSASDLKQLIAAYPTSSSDVYYML